METKICKQCNQELSLDNFAKSKITKDGYENKCKKCRLENRKKYTNICETCGNEFKTANKNTKYCCNKCKPQCQQDRITVKCSICGKEKRIIKSKLKNYKDFYCSDECKNKGYSLKYSGENSHKYSRINCNCEMCNKEFTLNKYEYENNNHHFCSKECRQKWLSIFMSGELSPNYNHNKTLEDRLKERKYIEYYKWRKQVYKRDNYTCQCCGDNKGHNLVAHHILNYSEYKKLRIDVNNGITLCKECHKEFHDKYGYKNNNEKQLNEFINKHGNQLPTK